MKFCIIIPAFNEGLVIEEVILSFISQTVIPNQLIIVDDNSSDNTLSIVREYTKKYSWITFLENKSSKNHQPGKKVIEAFYKGLESICLHEYDLIGKFDADILLPKNYFEIISKIFSENKKVGIASGNLYIENYGEWIYENISEKTKTRGPIKLYRRKCFEQIGGLKISIGWDTADELLAKYHGWEIVTDESLHVKHLKPTGKTYSKAARFKQGEAFYKLRYEFWLTMIASGKLAFLKKDFSVLINSLQGYFQAKKEKLPFLVSEKEGKFIRKLRWTKMKEKLNLTGFQNLLGLVF